MRLPRALTSLDDRFLGDRLRRRSSAGDEGAGVRDGEGTTGGARDGGRDHDERGRGRTLDRDDDRTSRRGPDLPRTGKGAAEALAVFYRVSRVVLLLLAAAVALGVVFVLAPTNPDNGVVELVDRIADGAAGPFRDVFSVDDDAEREVVVNYAFAAVVYLLAAALVVRLPGGRRG